MATKTRICIIRWRKGFSFYEAFADNGRAILHRPTYTECANAVELLNYAVLPPNTTWHRHILDRIEQSKGIVLQ